MFPCLPFPFARILQRMLTCQFSKFQSLPGIVKQMREQTESNSVGQATDSHESKKESLAKKRQIYKQKTSGSTPPGQRSSSKLTKQQRAKIQKQKNRQAAQRSRDIHKEYVTSLQRQISRLRLELQHSQRYCLRCQQLIQQYPEQGVYQPEHSFEAGHRLSQTDNFLPLHPELPVDSPDKEVAKEYAEPESFLRWLEPQEELPFMKLMLFVCMVVVGVMAFSNSQPSTPGRTLVQKYEEPRASELAAPVEEWRVEGGLVELNRGVQEQNCLDSLMRVESPSIRRSLSSIHTSYADPEEGFEKILLCSLRSPKQYEIRPEMAQTPIVRLFVLGSEIKTLLQRGGSLLPLTDRNIQLNGIYRLSAEIKSAELVSHHNCLL